MQETHDGNQPSAEDRTQDPGGDLTGVTRSAFGRAVHRYSIPNVLTTIRIALIPIFVWLLVAAGPLDGTRELDTALRWWALFAFCLLMITDQLDGHPPASRGHHRYGNRRSDRRQGLDDPAMVT